MDVQRLAAAQPSSTRPPTPSRPADSSRVAGLVPLRRDALTVTAPRQPLTLNVRQLEGRITRETGVAPTTGNKVQLYVDGQKAYPQIMTLINSAQKSLHLQMYIFKDDKASWDVAEALAARAASGVNVRVMADWQGSPTSSPIYDFLRANGVEVRHFTAQSLKNPAQVDHRKIIVSDGQKALTGGMNIADTYRESWHDAVVTVEGPAVHDIQRTFLDGWKTVGGGAVEPTSDVKSYAAGAEAVA